jgi:hypothetical protein
LLLITALAAAPALAADPKGAPTPIAKPNPPNVKEFTGLGTFPFGGSLADFQKQFPKAEPLPEGKDIGSPTIGGPYIRRFVLTDQKVDGVAKPTQVEVRFWKNKLWAVIVYYGGNDDAKIHAMLLERLGPNESGDEDNPLWQRAKTATTAQKKQRWYGVTDAELSKQAQAWFALMITGQWKGATDAELVELGLATPAPTAAAGATPTAAQPGK